MCRKVNTAQFIERAKAVHGDAYSYERVQYTKMKVKVEIFHKLCQRYFMVIPYEHLKGTRCGKCYNNKTKTTEEFIQQVKDKHGENTYEFSETKYVNSDTKVKIYCYKCNGYFLTMPTDILSGKRCGNCYRLKRKLLEKFIEQANAKHNFQYEYQDTIYVNDWTKIIVKHKQCNKTFIVTPSHHLQGTRCSHCYKSHRKTTQTFIEEARAVHGHDLYNYDSVVYKNAKTDVTIFCNRCKQYFNQKAESHTTQGCGCPYHANKTENQLYEWLVEQKFDVTRQEKFPSLFDKWSRFDFYIENLNIIIELDGEQHFKQVSNWESPEEVQKKDKNKMQFCYEYGITVIRIYRLDIADNGDWQSMLLPLIKRHDSPTVHLLSKHENIYDPYKPFVNDLLANMIPSQY